MQRVLLLLLVFVWGCTDDKPPKGTLERETMIQIMAEMELLKAYHFQVFDAEKTMEKQQLIMQHYKTDVETYRTSKAWYQERPNLFQPMVIEVARRLEEVDKAFKDKLLKRD